MPGVDVMRALDAVLQTLHLIIGPMVGNSAAARANYLHREWMAIDADFSRPEPSRKQTPSPAGSGSSWPRRFGLGRRCR